MDRLSFDEYRGLAAVEAQQCVSIYLPTHVSGRDTQGDPVRLKNLLKNAEEQLIARAMRPTLARDLLEPARQLLDDPKFWLHNMAALALFISDGQFRLFRLPIETDDLAVVGSTFHLKPLLPLLGLDVFHILAISLNSTKLFECSRYFADEVPLPQDVATSFAEAIGSKDHHVDRGLWRHGGGVRAQSQVADAHGHGPDQDSEMIENIAFYMRQLDEGVTRTIGDTTPLIVAAAESTWPDFLKVSRRKSIVDQPIRGNPEHVQAEALRDEGVRIMTPIWQCRINELAELFGTAQAQLKASDDVVEIVRAASEGRVATLVTSPAAVVWGEFDRGMGVVREGGNASVDLIDLAVTQTVLTSGEVVVADESSVPGDREAAAIMRY